MLSFNSLLFTIFAVIAIWKGFSFIQRLNSERQGSSTPAKPPRQSNATPSIDLVPCQRCGAYVDPKEGCRCTSSSA